MHTTANCRLFHIIMGFTSSSDISSDNDNDSYDNDDEQGASASFLFAMIQHRKYMTNKAMLIMNKIIFKKNTHTHTT